MKIVFGLGFCVFALVIKFSESYIEEVYKWDRVSFENLPKSENAFVGPYKYYDPENFEIDSIGYHPLSGLFLVTMQRFRPGVPTSLGAFCVDENAFGSTPAIWGFPNYQMNELIDSDFTAGETRSVGKHLINKYNESYSYDKERIISVLHITIDEKCNRVFFVDNGQFGYYRNTTYTIQYPALWVIDLPANGCKTRDFPIIRRTEFPNRIASIAPSGYMHMAFDYKKENFCDDLFVYIANPQHRSITVYDYRKNDFWLFDHETFKPIVAESNFVYDKTFDYSIPLGVYSITLGYPDKYGDRTVYYNSIASTAQYAVSTRILRDRRKAPSNFAPNDFQNTGHRGCGQQPLRCIIDYTHGVMLNTEVQSNETRCWNIKKPLNPDNIYAVDESDEYDFPIQAFIDSEGYFWFGTTHLPILIRTSNPLNLSEINSRVFRVKVSDIIKGTNCEISY